MCACVCVYIQYISVGLYRCEVPENRSRTLLDGYFFIWWIIPAVTLVFVDISSVPMELIKWTFFASNHPHSFPPKHPFHF